MQSCESRVPVLIEICSKNSFYCHPLPFAVSRRAAISFLRKSGHSIWINYFSGYLEQCRSVNPLSVLESSIRLKLTDRAVSIGSLVLLYVTVTFIILQNLLYHILKQCRPLSDIFHSSIGSLVLLHVTALTFIILQNLLYHISKQCRPLSDIFHSPSVL